MKRKVRKCPTCAHIKHERYGVLRLKYFTTDEEFSLGSNGYSIVNLETDEMLEEVQQRIKDKPWWGLQIHEKED